MLDVAEVQERKIATGAARDFVTGGVWGGEAGYQQILEHAHASEELRQLKGARDTHRGVNVRRPAGDAAAAHDHFAAVRLQMSRESVDQRRLAGAIRPDQADEIALAHDEVHRVVRDDTAEPLGEAAAANQLDPLAHALEPF